MRKRTSIFLYILLNIFISAATVLVVLWVWESAHPTPQGETGTAFLVDEANSKATEVPTALLEETEAILAFVSEDVQAVIHAIVGPGNLDVEYAEIHNQSPGPVDMTGWQLTDQDGQVFVFPALILNEGGAVQVRSKKGNNTVIELYWQSEIPIWQSGETAILLNADGDTIATYSIP